jgi:hypothetical protein
MRITKDNGVDTIILIIIVIFIGMGQGTTYAMPADCITKLT